MKCLLTEKGRKKLQEGEVELGMSLRDYFAAKAMQAIIGHPAALGAAAEKEKMCTTAFTAASAYEFADAMLEARKK